MTLLTRLRAHVGPWALVWLIVAILVGVTAAVGSVSHHLDDGALRDAVRDAPSIDRDLIASRTSRTALTSAPAAEPFRRVVLDVLPDALDGLVEEAWGFQRTEISQLEGLGASLTGDGVSREPAGFAPVVSLYTQTDLAADITVIDGRAPATDPSGEVVEVIVTPDVAAALGLTVGGEYVLHAGTVGLGPDQDESRTMSTVLVTGTFVPTVPDDPVWEHLQALREPDLMAVIQELGGIQPRALQAGLLTDPGGFRFVEERGLVPYLAPTTRVRVRFDVDRMDTTWAADVEEAVARVRTARELSGARIQSRLPGLIEDVAQRSVAVHALITLATGGIVGAGVMLLLATAGLIVQRRQQELHLLRARGGGLLRIALRTGTEGLPVVLTAAGVGWAVHRPLTSAVLARSSSLAVGADGLPPSTAGPTLVTMLLVGMLAVPLAAAWVARRATVARRPRISRPGPSPQRLTTEASVALVAVVGVAVARQRGLSGVDVDPLLSSVPLLLAVAAGLLILRLYPLPLRWLESERRTERGPVGYLAVARASRSGPGAIWTLLVVVAAAAVTGLAGGLDASLAVDDPADDRWLEPGTAFHAGLVLVLRASGSIGVLFVTLTVAVLLVMPSAERARQLALLHTLGLRRRQAGGLVVAEFLPPVVVAVVTGLTVGVATPVLLGRALGLEALIGVPTPRPTMDGSAAALIVLLPVALSIVGALIAVARPSSGRAIDPDAAM